MCVGIGYGFSEARFVQIFFEKGPLAYFWTALAVSRDGSLGGSWCIWGWILVYFKIGLDVFWDRA